MKICLIRPGTGVSGRYTAEVLRKAAKKITAYLPIYDARETEHNIQTQRGIVLNNATYETNGESGEGIYVDVSLYPSFESGAVRFAGVATVELPAILTPQIKEIVEVTYLLWEGNYE